MLEDKIPHVNHHSHQPSLESFLMAKDSIDRARTPMLGAFRINVEKSKKMGRIDNVIVREVVRCLVATAVKEKGKKRRHACLSAWRC